MTWQRIDERSAADLLDFRGVRPDDANLAQVAPAQLRGAVALYNRLAERRLVWLADEVGMGKTYVALGVVALLRHQNPDARVLFLVPSGRLQAKWRKEIELFTRMCVKQIDHRARTWQDLPARPLVEPPSLYELAVEMAVDGDRDVLASMSSFSFPLGEEREEWQERWGALVALAPHLPPRLPDVLVKDKGTFKGVYAAALNLLIPSFDLVVCDESHNLRAGAGHGAARNQTLAAALGGRPAGVSLPWAAPPMPHVARLLCLSATPVERRYEELTRQAQVFGLDLHPDLPASVGAHLSSLAGGPGGEDARKEIARRYVVRRLQELRPDGAQLGAGLTKNQYRQEWRQGGIERYDERLSFASDREKLVVALVQKRVVELLHQTGARAADGSFLPSFQMGMLSSFESFSETIANRVEKVPQPAYDGDDQTTDATERQGVDSGIVDRICRSYRTTFRTSPPHPKMDQVAEQVARWAAAGDKTLIFVRRVRTTEELAGKVAQRLDGLLIARVLEEAPSGARAELDGWLDAWRETRRNADVARPVADSGDDDDDTGGANSFFAWFFRGSGIEAHQVAAKLRKETFQRGTHPWSIFFHDNHVAWLFGDDAAKVAAWAAAHADGLVTEVRRFFPEVATPGPRHYFEAWQAAALELRGREDDAVGRVAREARQRLYRARKSPWHGDPGGPEWLARGTFFSLLRASPLGDHLWPGAGAIRGGSALAEREVRRELMASTLRLGHPFVDLWLTAVRLLGVLSPGEAEVRIGTETLAGAFLERLHTQRDGARAHNAWHELSSLATHHRLIVDVNFSSVGKTELADLRVYFQAHLSRQSPALAMSGSSKSSQALTQFRMPGYPLVLVATDVLQEGVDLHTFCGRVVHYGIAHTSSATEQRTGRIDRIGSLAHRRFRPDDDLTRLQVHYPHLLDTVEPLQLRELYRRMDLFLRLVHDGLGRVEEETSRVSLTDGMQREVRYPAPPTERLKTAFDVTTEGPDNDLVGDPLLLLTDIYMDWDALDGTVRSLLRDVRRPQREPRWIGEVEVPGPDGHPRRQPVDVSLRSRRDGRGAYARVKSPVGAADLADGRTAGRFLRRQSTLVGVVVTLEARGSRRRPFVVLRCDMPLVGYEDPSGRISRAIRAVATQADALEQEFFGVRQDLGAGDWE